MSQVIAAILIAVGGLWAILGIANVAMNKAADTSLLAFVLIINAVLFVLPGLVVTGIGALLLKRAK